MTLDDALKQSAIVAITRGVRPDEAVAIGEALYAGGVRAMEVPLNSPDPLTSIAALAKAFEGRMAVGAGTVLSPDKVDGVHQAGGRFIITPNTRPDVIRRALCSAPDPRLRLVIGYAGWGPGQLDNELAASAWLMAPVEADLVFEVPVDRMWETAIRRLGAEPSALQSSSGVH